jgi:hypothetical protein
MEKEKLVKIGTYLGGAVLVVLLFFVSVRFLGVRLPFLPGTKPVIEPEPTRVPSDSDIIVSQPVSSSGKTLRTTFKDERFYYAFQGRISGKLQNLDDRVIGEITLDDDTTGMKFPVEFTPRNEDKYLLARFKNLFAQGFESVTYVTGDEFVASIVPDTEVQFRMMYHPAAAQTAEDAYLREFFEAIIEGQPFTPKRVTIRPVAVGILEK